MLNLTNFGGNVETDDATCECVLCGEVQRHDVCDECHMSNPDGSLDCETLDELIPESIGWVVCFL